MASKKSRNKAANAGGYNFLHKDARLQRKERRNMSKEQILSIGFEDDGKERSSDTDESVERWYEQLPSDVGSQVDIILMEFKKLHDRINLQEAALDAADQIVSHFSGVSVSSSVESKINAYTRAREKCREVER